MKKDKIPSRTNESSKGKSKRGWALKKKAWGKWIADTHIILILRLLHEFLSIWEDL